LAYRAWYNDMSGGWVTEKSHFDSETCRPALEPIQPLI